MGEFDGITFDGKSLEEGFLSKEKDKEVSEAYSADKIIPKPYKRPLKASSSEVVKVFRTKILFKGGVKMEPHKDLEGKSTLERAFEVFRRAGFGSWLSLRDICELGGMKQGTLSGYLTSCLSDKFEDVFRPIERKQKTKVGPGGAAIPTKGYLYRIPEGARSFDIFSEKMNKFYNDYKNIIKEAKKDLKINKPVPISPKKVKEAKEVVEEIFTKSLVKDIRKLEFDCKIYAIVQNTGDEEVDVGLVSLGIENELNSMKKLNLKDSGIKLNDVKASLRFHLKGVGVFDRSK